jgi:hypothetical protein
MKAFNWSVAIVAVISVGLSAWSAAQMYTKGRGLVNESVLVVGVLVGLAAAGAAAFLQRSMTSLEKIPTIESGRERHWRG